MRPAPATQCGLRLVSDPRFTYISLGWGEDPLVFLPRGAQVRAIHRAAVNGTDSAFDLGNLGVAASFLFEIVSGGDSPISGITLSSSSPSVEVTPASINLLAPAGTGGVWPIIQVQVLHGVGANGYGSAPVLPPGPLSFIVTAAGTDGSGPVSATATMSVFVQVAAYTVLVQGTDLSTFNREAGLTDLPTGVDYNLPAYIGATYANQAAALPELSAIALSGSGWPANK